MGRPTVLLELVADSRLASDLGAGGVLVQGCDLAFNDECELVVRCAGTELRFDARIVYVDGKGGAGLELIGFNPAMKEQLAELAESAPAVPEPTSAAFDDSAPFVPEPASAELDESATATATAATSFPLDLELDFTGDASEAAADSDTNAVITFADIADSPDAPPDAEDDGGDLNEAGSETVIELDETGTDEERRLARNMHERLRGLTVAEQIKKAHSVDPAERILLERMYGKSVWEPLLRNPRLTPPEVARLARLGTLPRTMLEVIVGNGAWLQIPEVRRALLSNHRLGTDQILRVLRLMPKHELKLAAMATAYPHSVRDAAKRLIKDAGG